MDNTSDQCSHSPPHTPSSHLEASGERVSDSPLTQDRSLLEHRLSGPRPESHPPHDEYRSMIRELLRFDSRLSSLSSSSSSHPFTGVTDTPSTASSIASTTVEIEAGNKKERESPTSVLLPEANFDAQVHIGDVKSKYKSQSGLKDKVCDYSNRILRYVTPIKVFVVIILLAISILLFYFLRVDLSETKSILCLLLLWLSLVGYYLCIPTFKRWFNYWESQ